MAPQPNLTFKEQMDGFPWSQILVIALMRLSEPIAFSSLFTYVVFMVEDLGIAHTKEQVSSYSGFLASSFALCQVVTSVFWGRFADKYGRKPAVIIGLSGSVISVLIFGFAKNYWVAFLARCLMGTLNGNVAVVRAMLGEVAKEKRHQALSFSVVPLIWNLGCVIGPLIGGYLSGKETQFESMKGFVEKYPYARPNIVIAVLLCNSIFIALFFLEDTHHAHQYRNDVFVNFMDKFLVTKLGFSPKVRPWHLRLGLDEEQTIPLTTLNEDGEDLKGQETPDKNPAATSAEVQSEDGVIEKTKLTDILTPALIAALLSNFLHGLHAVVCEEFIPVFVSTEIAQTSEGQLLSRFPFKLIGGLGYAASDTGKLLSSTGMFSVVFIILILPHINRKLGTLTIYRLFSIPFPILFALVPYIVFLAHHASLAQWLIYFFSVIRTLCLNLILPQLNVIIYICSPPKQRAFVSGISIMCTSSARCLGPFLWGMIMSVGQSYEIAWLPWWLLCALAVTAIVYSKNLRDDDEEEEEE